MKLRTIEPQVQINWFLHKKRVLLRVYTEEPELASPSFMNPSTLGSLPRDNTVLFSEMTHEDQSDESVVAVNGETERILTLTSKIGSN